MTKEQKLIKHIQRHLTEGIGKSETCYLDKDDLEVIIKALEQELSYEDMNISHHEKECEFCQNHEQGDCLYEINGWDGGISVSVSFDYVRPIKYCPLCGRKLKSENEK